MCVWGVLCLIIGIRRRRKIIEASPSKPTRNDKGCHNLTAQKTAPSPCTPLPFSPRGCTATHSEKERERESQHDEAPRNRITSFAFERPVVTTPSAPAKHSKDTHGGEGGRQRDSQPWKPERKWAARQGAARDQPRGFTFAEDFL